MRSRFNRRLDMQTRFAKAKRKNLVYSSPGLHRNIVILDGLKPDFNIGKIFRSADAFGVNEIHLIGIDFFDPEPAKGSLKWMVFHFHEDFAACFRFLSDRGYTLYTLEPESGEQLGKVALPEKSGFIMGHEEFGISFDLADYPEIQRLSIPQWGHVQSLNVSVAASIVMFEYVRQHGKPAEEGLPQMKAAINSRKKRVAG